MERLKSEDIAELIGYQGERPCVSIYLPTHRITVDVPKDRLRLKNLLNASQQALESQDLRSSQIQELLGPVEDLMEDSGFWQNQGDGLALFSAPAFFRSYRLPLRFPELLVAADRFHIKPLLPLINRDGDFYLLDLDLNQLRLWHGSRYDMEPVPLNDGMPTSLAQALQYDEYDKQRNFNPLANKSGASGDRQAIYYGQGANVDREKTDIRRYLQQVAQGIAKQLVNQKSPLVLSGVEYLVSMYRDLNTYGNVIDQAVVGSHEATSEDELRRAAWQLIEPGLHQKQAESAERFAVVRGNDSAKTPSDLGAIVRAAYVGRVDTLFVPLNVQQWGTFEPETQKVKYFDQAGPGRTDLLDFAAAHTLLNGGTAFAVDKQELPCTCPAAAILRY